MLMKRKLLTEHTIYNRLERKGNPTVYRINNSDYFRDLFNRPTLKYMPKPRKPY